MKVFKFGGASVKDAKGDVSGVMSDEEVAKFVQYYQRITEHALRTLPSMCDTVYTLDDKRAITKQDVNK